MSSKYKLAVLVCLAMVLLSLIPQIHLWLIRGREWNGAYVSTQGDEPQYSAYVNSLIEGRTRKNDPFGARDDSSSAPLPESIFSIQFIPAYVIALPARALGISASTAFVILIAVAAALAGLSVLWLLNYVTDDHRLASAGTLFVLCLGAFAGGHGLVGILLKADLSIPTLPFLRRYEPAVAFPLFFVFQVLVLSALTRKQKKESYILTIMAALTLVTLVFSYLYLWTAAAAWLICIGALWLYFRAAERRRTLAILLITGILTTIGLVPYAYLLSNRAKTLDQQQVLSLTHSPDLLHVTEILGGFIIATLVIRTLRMRVKRDEARVLFAASLSLLPFIVFNQQILTGHKMQVYHFEAFVVNYSTLVALVITATVLWNAIPDRLLVSIGALSLLLGLLEVSVPSRLAYVPAAVAKDLSVPVLRRLKELSKKDGTEQGLRTIGRANTSVFSPNVGVIALLPSWTSQGTLLDISGVDCGTATREDRKEFFLAHLYYSNVQSEGLRKQLTEKDQFAVAMILGHERIFPALSSHFEPIQPDEIEREVQTYQTYANSFSREEGLKRLITYAIIPVGGNFNFTNLDRWYERDAGERVGDYVLYRLKLRP